MGRVEDGQTVHDLGVVHRRSPGGGSAPVVADQPRGLGAAFADQIAHVGGQLAGGVSRDAVGLRRQVVAAQVGRDHPETGRRERRDLQPPAVPELREAVQQDDQRSVAGLDVMEPHLVADLGVALTKFGSVVEHHADGRARISGRRAHRDLLSGLTRAVTAHLRCRASVSRPSPPWSAPWSRLSGTGRGFRPAKFRLLLSMCDSPVGAVAWARCWRPPGLGVDGRR